MTTVEVSPEVLQEQARQAFRESVAAELPLSGAALGRMFDRSPRWGRDRIAETRTEEGATVERQPQEDGGSEPAAAPVAVSQSAARFTAWVGFILGSLVSVAGNWLAAWLPEGGRPPSVAAQVGAAVWPVALLVSVEVLSRTPWRPGWQWVLVRLGGTAVVALGSAVISYGHIHEVLLSWGYDPTGAGVGPLVIDGLMIVSGFALLSMSRVDTNGRE